MEFPASDRVSGITFNGCEPGRLVPPVGEIVDLIDHKAAAIYALFWQSAIANAWAHQSTEVRFSVKYLKSRLGMSDQLIANRIDALLDYGFIALGQLDKSRRGSPSWSYKVLHPSQIPGQREAIEIMGAPSIRRKNQAEFCANDYGPDAEGVSEVRQWTEPDDRPRLILPPLQRGIN
jgi:hypothetical protein